jgi:hypothetical protein
MNIRNSRSPLSRTRSAVLVVLSTMFTFSGVGCSSTAGVTVPLDLEAAIERLRRPLPGDPAALYRLRVSTSGGLRMAVLTSGEEGRLTVSEPFGSAVSLIAWSGSLPPTFFDHREGCRLDAADLELVLGVGTMPPPQAVRLLGGRLPAIANDRVVASGDGRILIEGRGWAAQAVVDSDPWRVVSVEEVGDRRSGWRLELSDHTYSVPGRIRVENGDGRWAELELVRLEWNEGGDLPSLPDLRPCVLEPEP